MKSLQYLFLSSNELMEKHTIKIPESAIKIIAFLVATRC